MDAVKWGLGVVLLLVCGQTWALCDNPPCYPDEDENTFCTDEWCGTAIHHPGGIPKPIPHSSELGKYLQIHGVNSDNCVTKETFSCPPCVPTLAIECTQDIGQPEVWLWQQLTEFWTGYAENHYDVLYQWSIIEGCFFGGGPYSCKVDTLEYPPDMP